MLVKDLIQELQKRPPMDVVVLSPDDEGNGVLYLDEVKAGNDPNAMFIEGISESQGFTILWPGRNVKAA